MILVLKSLAIINKDNAHSISIKTMFNGHPSLHECSTQQVSAMKVPSKLISEKKRFDVIMKDGSVDTQKNLFPKTSKSKTSKGRSKRNSNLMLHNSRNPSVGDSRYSSSLITVKKPSIKSKLFKYKKGKKVGITEMHSNKSNSSMRKTCTPLYMFRQVDPFNNEKSYLSTHGNFKKIISEYHEQGKKKSSKSRKRRNSRKKSTTKKDKGKGKKRPSSALGYAKHKNQRSSSKGKHLRNNESLFLDPYRSKEHTLRQEETSFKMKKTKVSRNNSKSYIKVHGFDFPGAKTGTSKGRMKNLSTIDYTIQTSKRNSKSKGTLFTSQYQKLAKAPKIAMSTRNLSLDKNDQSAKLVGFDSNTSTNMTFFIKVKKEWEVKS